MNSELIRQIKPFTVMPLAVLCDSRLEDGDKVILAALWSYAGASNEVWPKHGQLSERVGGVPRRTVLRSLERLRQAGWITWKRGQRGNRYTLNPTSEKTSRCATGGASEKRSRCATEDTSEGILMCHLRHPDVPPEAHLFKEEPELEPELSSSSVPPVARREEEEIASLKTGEREPEPEDVSELAAFMAETLEASTGKPAGVQPRDAQRARLKAPGWTIAEIVEGLRKFASTGKPQNVRWFPATIADVYDRTDKKAPVIVRIEKCPHGQRIWRAHSRKYSDCWTCQNAFDEEAQKPGIACVRCMDSGRMPCAENLYTPCYCETGRRRATENERLAS